MCKKEHTGSFLSCHSFRLVKQLLGSCEWFEGMNIQLFLLLVVSHCYLVTSILHAPRAAQPFVRSKEGSSTSSRTSVWWCQGKRYQAAWCAFAGGSASRKFGGSGVCLHASGGEPNEWGCLIGGRGLDAVRYSFLFVRVLQPYRRGEPKARAAAISQSLH